MKLHAHPTVLGTLAYLVYLPQTNSAGLVI
jgi:hypothetical protein